MHGGLGHLHKQAKLGQENLSVTEVAQKIRWDELKQASMFNHLTAPGPLPLISL